MKLTPAQIKVKERIEVAVQDRGADVLRPVYGAGGPGSELVLLWWDMPKCQQCYDLAQKMDKWGVEECQDRLEEIIDDILPRAKKWIEAEKPWLHTVLTWAKPLKAEGATDFAIRQGIKRDVQKAIQTAEQREREKYRQNDRGLPFPSDAIWESWLFTGGTLTLGSDELRKFAEVPTHTENILLILSPRHIDRCITSLTQLPIDQLWLRGMTEVEITPLLNKFIETTGYANYLLAADDLVVNNQALSIVEGLLVRYELATGYCKMSEASDLCNVTRGPVRRISGRYPRAQDYSFYHLGEIKRWPVGEFKSWFGGWTLTGMRRQLWLDYPFRVNEYTGAQSDYEVCLSVNRQFTSHTDALCEHLKHKTHQPLRENWLVGTAQPHLVYRRYNAQTGYHHTDLETSNTDESPAILLSQDATPGS